MALQDRLDTFKADFEAGKLAFKPAPEALDIMHRATAELVASGQALNAKKAGDKAPGFALKDPDGNIISLTSLLENGPLVVSFYRGVWCPYCNLELQALQAALPEIEQRGARVAAISPQTSANSRKSQRDNKLTFPILSDEKSRSPRRSDCAFRCLTTLWSSTRASRTICRRSTTIRRGCCQCRPVT